MDPIVRIGEPAPFFQLSDSKGRIHSFEDLRGWLAVINFWSAECTWCERVDREIIDYLPTWKKFAKVWWIASNDNEAPDFIDKVAGERKLDPILLDAHQQVADTYGAQTTPHFFVVDKNGILVYQGAWDDVTFRQRTATQLYVPGVVEALANNQTLKLTSTTPYGCILVRSFEEKH